MIKQKFSDRYLDCKCIGKREYKLSNLQYPAVFSVDCVFKKAKDKGKRCDEIIFCDLPKKLTGIYLVEIKTKNIDPKEVKNQLKGSIEFIATFLRGISSLKNQNFDYKPILVSQVISRPVLRELQAIRIKLPRSRKRRTIAYVKTGDPLPKL